MMGAGLALAASASVFMTAAPAAHAANTDVIAAAGSDTTMDVMAAILAADGTPAKTFNIRAGAYQSSPLTVPGAVADGGDGHCATYVYQAVAGGVGTVASPLSAPDGSGAGRTAISSSLTATAPYNTGAAVPNASTLNVAPNGCVDIARSSSYSSSFDPGTAEFYAFAVDASTWGSASPNSPASLTQSQIQGIYNCTFTDWSQVGGTPGPIQRVLFQLASGTGQAFLSQVVGVDTNGAQLPATAANCPAVIRIQENEFDDMYNGTNNHGGGQGDAKQYANAIAPYSVGKWSYQASHSDNPTIDLRAGFRPGGIVTDRGSAQGPVVGVAWTGSKWQPNNAQIVGKTGATNRSESLKTTNGSNTVTLVPSTRNVTSVTISASGLQATAATGQFTQNDVGGGITSAPNIPSGTIITGVTDNGSNSVATLSKVSTAGSGLTVVVSSHFLSTDQGAALSGNIANITNGTTISLVIDATHAQLSAPAVGTDAVGTSTTIAPTSQVHEVISATTTVNTKNLDAPAGTFSGADVGKVVEAHPSGLNTNCSAFGTRVVSIGDSGAGAGSRAVLAGNSPLTCSGNASVKIGFTAVSEGTVLAQSGALSPFPGARFVWNVIEHGSASYTDARNLVGYQDAPGGAKSPLCSGHHTTTVDPSGDDAITDNGFLPIQPHTSVGGNTGVTCYLIAN